MRRLSVVLVCAIVAVVPGEAPGQDAPKAAGKAPAGAVRFRVQEIDRTLKVGYAVALADVNADGKPDIVVVDTDRVVWFENPSWRRRTMLQGKTKPDNVCIAAADIDGDGKIDFALGAGWKMPDTKNPGTLQWLRRGPTLDDPWELHPIPCDEPTVHRIRFADVDGDGKPELVLAPLMGRDSSNRRPDANTPPANWLDGRPVRLVAYKVPADPVKGPWVPTVLDESLHVVHNFHPVPAEGRKGFDLLAASYEGVSLVSPDAAGKWAARRIGEGNQMTPQSNRGASEIKQGRFKNGLRYIATIEPWHGYQVVVYTPPGPSGGLWDREVLDSRLRWGHAVWCADLDGDGDDELIIGVRDNPARTDDFPDKCGVRIYKCRDGRGRSWERKLVDPGGVAVEDLAAADLNGDGRIDLVAVARATSNVRIYWNEP
jgi:hypothetical protein